MIRITCKDEGLTKIVRIAGRLEEQHLERLGTACNASDGTLTLDLSELQSADADSIRWLQTRKARGAAIVGVSPFIALLLERSEAGSKPRYREGRER